jgi:hypothetical protein
MHQLNTSEMIRGKMHFFNDTTFQSWVSFIQFHLHKYFKT